MSYSQFSSVKKTTKPGPKELDPRHVRVEVSGPLRLHAKVTYVMPITIVFSLIQNAKKADGDLDHDAKKAHRVSGFVRVADPKATKWTAVVGLDPKVFRGEEAARGVGVAVLEQVEQFG